MSLSNSGKGILLDAGSIAKTFLVEVTDSLAKCPRRPKLIGILATSSAPSKFYAEFTRKRCAALDVDFVLKKIGAAVSPELPEGDGVEEAIIEANEDDSIDGIMVRNLCALALDDADFFPGVL